jgi:predicted amidohydrolase YtcJ
MQTLDTSPDLLIVNGTVLTVDPVNRIAEAVAVNGGRIVAVGSSADIERLRTPRATLIDLAGRTLIPGLIDPHVHLADHGTNLAVAVDVRDLYGDVRSIEDILARLRVRAQNVPAGQWIIGFGSPLPEERLPEARFPHRRELDAISPNNPMTVAFGGHINIANSRALELAGITSATPSPDGGHIELDPSTGELTGKILERAQLILRAAISKDIPVGYSTKTNYRDVKTGIIFGATYALSRGVTSAHDIIVANVAWRAYQELAAEGKLPLRTSLIPRIVDSSIKPESLLNLGIMTGFGDDWLRLGGVKMSIDGGITGKSAYFHEPYESHDNEHEHDCFCGLLKIPDDELHALVDEFHRAGHRLCVHAIGDHATDMAIDAIERAVAATPRADHRHRIEHFGNWMATPERIARVRKMEVIAAANLSFMHSIVKPLRSFIGAERLRGAFSLRSLLEAGVPFTSGSDGPGYWPMDPLRDVGIAVSRRTLDDEIVEPSEAIDVRQALRMCTIDAAFAGFEERVKGSIEPGKLADFAILAENPYETAPERIPAIDVDATIVNGTVAFQRGRTEVRV